MGLFARTLVGITAAFVLTFGTIGVIKMHRVDPQRRQTYFELRRPLLEEAARQLADKPERAAKLEELNRRWGPGFRIEDHHAPKEQGWFVNTEGMFGYQRLSDGATLLSGPFPDIDPGTGILKLLALSIPMLIAGLITFVIIAPLIRRIRALERVTRRLADGDLSARMPEGGRDELSSLVRNFNRMGGEIEALLQSRQELLQAVSHEFRTPAARIRFELELLDGETDPVEISRRIQGIDENLSEMDALVDELLMYTRLDHNPSHVSRDSLSPVAMAEELAALLKPQGTVELEVRGSPSIRIEANDRYLRRAIQNLLSNAMRFAESRVTVEVRDDEDAVVITVSDDGPGIPMGDRARIFAPFFRLDNQPDSAKGTGLGLAIVDRICEWHGGTVEALAPKEGAGTIMQITLPKGSA